MIETEKLLATAFQLTKRLPKYCGHLDEYQIDGWTPMNRDDPDFHDELEIAITRSMKRFLHFGAQEEIDSFQKDLPQNTRKALFHVLPGKWGEFFSPYTEIPNLLNVPSPFHVINRNQGPWIAPENPIFLQYGRTKLEIAGVVPTVHDKRVFVALLDLSKKKKSRNRGDSIFFVTTIPEIGKVMHNSNPWQKSARDSIWRSLKRLRLVSITVHNRDGRIYLGGILNSVVEEDHNKELGIYLNVALCKSQEFTPLNYYQDGYLFFKELSDKEVNVYTYLYMQREFKIKGTLGWRRIDKVYDQMALSLNPQSKSEKAKIREFRQILHKLKHNHAVIRDYGIEDGKFCILNKK